MSILSEIRAGVDDLAAHSGLDVDGALLLGAMRRMGDDEVVETVAGCYKLINRLERIATAGSGVVAERSTRDLGHGGLAAVRGHKTPVELVQAISGGTRADAVRTVRAGESLLDGVPLSADGAGDEAGGADAGDPAEPQVLAVPWHDPLRRALLAGGLTAAQHDAIFRGLGEPPVVRAGVGADGVGADGVDGAEAGVDAAGDDPADVMRQVWSIAAVQLIEEASTFSVEELRRRARQVRDALDSVGAEERFAKHYQERSFRKWVDADGRHHAHISFDDEVGAWVDAVLGSALRPRRGGPRFISDNERAAAEALIDDPRTNDQLQYDLLMDVFRAGALASASDVFGARQPGVRMIVVKDLVGPRDAVGRLLASGNVEDGGDALPGSVIDRALCTTGSVDVIVDSCGNPLDVGREQRLFTTKQKISLAARDGGCMWPGCTLPGSYCEAHHIDRWTDGGKTNTDRGILLCRYHHMLLHNNGWVIERDGLGRFILHPPADGSSGHIVREMRSRSAVSWAWDPPPDRARWRDRQAA